MNPHDHADRWHSRGRLPHFEGGRLSQFITFRLFDSVPQSAISKWKRKLQGVEDEEAHKEFARRIENYLDRGFGNAYLKNPNIADMVRETLFIWDDAKYKLYSWVIMPNHVHLLLSPNEGYFSLTEIMHSIKSYTANRANKLLLRSGAFWQHESFDRFIRNYQHFTRVVAYIENNPVKAKLCRKPGEWEFSSACPRDRED